MKIQIIKSGSRSGYFSGDIIEIDDSFLESIKQHNDIIILEKSEPSKKVTKKKQ